ncbi:MAG: response regulator [Rhodocyclaceae bacterium]|nr:response regulator [Rhodocyclaceae bacterium]MDZ4214777.1 response regulator [Rhodocyclaceae bacterium]
MTQRHILVVDDEPINLMIIREYLDGPQYDLDLVESATTAWQRLETAAPAYDLVILDRMMPGMTGIELLRLMKTDPRFNTIPVIMQTAATAPEQVREGIEAGAYYYLAKPYEPETLLAIVRAAVTDIESREAARGHARAHVHAMDLLEHAEFRFRTLGEIGPLIEILASLCPIPDLAAGGLTELLVNAVEHGSLGISYEEKRRLRLADGWEAEVARRLAMAENARQVRVSIRRHADRLEFTVQDEGCGFDWQQYLDFDPERAADPNGRGIAMARMMSFSALEYRGNGNTVVATIALPGGALS